MILFKLINAQTGDIVIDSKVNNLTELKKETKEVIRILELESLQIDIDKYGITILTDDGEYIASAVSIDFKKQTADQIRIYYDGLQWHLNH